MHKNRIKEHRNYRSAQKIFDIDPQLLRRINQLDNKNNDYQLKQQYKTHKKQQKQILSALDSVKHQYLNRQRKVLIAAEKAIKEIRKVQNYIQEHLDITKEQQLDQIEPQVQKFLIQSKSLKRLITQNTTTNPELQITDFTKIVRQINYLKDKLELFDPTIQKFCEYTSKFENKIQKCTKFNTNNQRNKQIAKNMECQTILDYSNIASKKLEEESDIEKIFINSMESKSTKMKCNLIEKGKFVSDNNTGLPNREVQSQNIQRRLTQQLKKITAKDNKSQEQINIQKNISNQNNNKQYRALQTNLQSVTSIQKNQQSIKNPQVSKNLKQQRKIHQEALIKIQSIFSNQQHNELQLNSQISIPAELTAHHELALISQQQIQHDPTRQLSNLSMRQLQSIKSQQSLFSKKSLTSQRSGSRNKNCLQVLRKQKLKYDELKSLMSN